MALKDLGINLAASGINAAIDDFQKQNLVPGDILAFANSLPTTVGGATGLGSIIPGLGRIPLPTKKLNDLLSIPQLLKTGAENTWQSTLYGSDLNAHQPKFKFLFKVLFIGFPGGEFYRYVHRCDKPRVRINHQDVNYYNFRTRVQTSVTYDPLTMSFLDDISNSVNEFFTGYMAKRTGTAQGNASIMDGFGNSGSSKPYKNGYSEGKAIIIEQIFANGTRSNRFTFVNPRIESFDFDELNMEDSNGNMVNITFSYDAFTSETVNSSTLYSWGNTDLLKGGGTSGPPNGGDTNGGGGVQQSANGRGVGNGSQNNYNSDDTFAKTVAGFDLLNLSKGSLGETVNSLIPRGIFNQNGVIGSAATTLFNDMSNSIKNVFNGNNLKFGGATAAESFRRQELNAQQDGAPTASESFRQQELNAQQDNPNEIS